ncbi:hypothetical protein C9374_011739 [Naegleria lovaniensis]|uniref:Uncharacterized protein n=1 Tax=Naegleria lovaniensis TaxID=51637 RepID=A0AA88GED1_NAELO|nr:uncharacterized protein C9374_011739 [Naegleria lovaniensis]KAG2373854.1 hypothetical protein C9374_011739 [Naegleria lovaniensis]
MNRYDHENSKNKSEEQEEIPNIQTEKQPQQQSSTSFFSSPYDKILSYISEDTIKAYDDSEGFRLFCLDQKYDAAGSRVLEAADYATCRALCERYYVLHLLQSVTQKVAILAIVCMLHRYDDEDCKNERFHISENDKELLKQWNMLEVIQFVNVYYKQDYEQFKEMHSTGDVMNEEIFGEPNAKKIKTSSNEETDNGKNASLHTSGNSRIGKIKFDSTKFKNFYSSLLVMKELIEKEQTSHDDLVSSIENIHAQHVFSCIRYFNSSYGKNPMLERFYYHILELYRQTDHKMSCIKVVKFGIFCTRRHVQLLTQMLENILCHESIGFDRIEKFLKKHIKHCKANEKCLEGILLFFCDCTDVEMMTKIFVESIEIDDSFAYSYGNLGYLRGFNLYGNRDLTVEGINYFHETLKRTSIADLHLLTVNAFKTLGILNVIIGNIPESIRCCSKALQIHPNFFDIIKDRCEMSGMMNDIPSALRDLQKCLEIGPQRKKDLSELYNIFAIFQQKLGTSLDDVKMVLENALRVDPTNSYPFLTLSTLAIEQQDLDEYLDLRLVFHPTSYQGVCDLLSQDVAAFRVFDPIHNTQLEEEYRTKKSRFIASHSRIS